MENNCIICEIINAREEVIFETEHFFAFLDKNPVTPGHVIVVPKQHVVSLFDLSSDEWQDLQIALIGTAKSIAQLDKPKIYSEWIEAEPQSSWVESWRQALAYFGVNRKPDGYNIGVNEGEAAGRAIAHVHVHMIPRYFEDDKKPGRGLQSGLRKVIPGMGTYKDEM